MRSPWHVGVTGATVVAFLGFLVLGFVRQSSALFRHVQTPTVAAVLAVSLVLPVSMYLDVRSFDEHVTWSPRRQWWLLAAMVPIVNLVPGTAYVFRRRASVGETTPSPRWQRLLVVTLALWVVLYPLEYGLPAERFSRSVRDVLALVALFASVAMPTATLLDAVRVRELTAWDPVVRAYVPGTALPFVNLVVAPVYLYRRRQAFADAVRSDAE